MENNSKLYTGSGDKGYTKTQSSFRVSKSDSIIELIGTLEEFQASLAVADGFISDKELSDDISLVLDKVGGIIDEVGGGRQSVTKDCIKAVENMIDGYTAKIAGYGGNGHISKESAMLKSARAVVRRCERAAVKAGQFGRLKPELIAYLNRLSDLMLAFADYVESKSNNGSVEAIEISGDIKPQNVSVLTLSMAKTLSEEIEKQGKSMGLNIVVAIADGGANLMLLHSMDDAYIASSKIAQDKAYTSVALKMPTITALELSRGGALDGLSYTSENRIILLGGGEPLKIGEKIVGGLGVSGGTAEEDTALARFGAELFTRLYS